MKKQLLGWEVFWISDLHDLGKTEYTSTRFPNREAARRQMRRLKAQPWAFRKIFMCRVSHDLGRTIWKKVR